MSKIIQKKLASIIMEYTYNDRGYGRDEKKDYWALLTKAGIHLYDNGATKILAAAKVKEQMLLLESVGSAILQAKEKYYAEKQEIEERLKAERAVVMLKRDRALASIPHMEKPENYKSILFLLLNNPAEDAKYDEYLRRREEVYKTLAAVPEVPRISNSPELAYVHNQWCHIFAISRIHHSFVKSKNLEKVYTAARRRERTAKVAASEAHARRGSGSVRDNLLAALPSNFLCPYCGKKINAEKSEADHTHPVTKGGLTVPTNMVMVCTTCNGQKSGDTLRQFCKKTKKDFNKVCDELEKLGKDV